MKPENIKKANIILSIFWSVYIVGAVLFLIFSKESAVSAWLMMGAGVCGLVCCISTLSSLKKQQAKENKGENV